MRNQRHEVQKPNKKSDKPSAKDHSADDRDKVDKKRNAAIAVLRYRHLISG